MALLDPISLRRSCGHPCDWTRRLDRGQCREEAPDLHVEEIGGAAHARSVCASRGCDDDLFTALTAKRAVARTFLVEKRRVDAAGLREELLCSLENFVGCHRRRG